MKRQNLPLDTNWITTDVAAYLLGNEQSLREPIARLALRTRSASHWSQNCQGAGRLWWREDVLRVLAVMKAARVRHRAAMRVLLALKQGAL